MDLNYLYYRHQISLYRSENAACERSRIAHAALANAYASRIEQSNQPRLALAP